jgi:hypothetical protein
LARQQKWQIMGKTAQQGGKGFYHSSFKENPFGRRPSEGFEGHSHAKAKEM